MMMTARRCRKLDHAKMHRAPSIPHHVIAPPEQALAFGIARCADVRPDRAAIAQLLNLRTDRPEHGRWFAALDELLEKLPRVMRPRYLFRIDAVKPRANLADATPPPWNEVALSATSGNHWCTTLPEDAAHLPGDLKLELRSGATFVGNIGRFLRHAQLVATFVATIGPGVGRLSRGWLKRGGVLQGTLADAIASATVEAVAERCQADVRAWARTHHLDVTPRFSPGYCGMSLQQQRELFASLPTTRIGVRLRRSCLMTPIKSISGLIGIGDARLVGERTYPCEQCNHSHCPQRRAPQHNSSDSH